MFKKKYQIEVNEKEYNIIVSTLNEYRNKQLLKGNIVDYLDKILFKLKRILLKIGGLILIINSLIFYSTYT